MAVMTFTPDAASRGLRSAVEPLLVVSYGSSGFVPRFW